MDSNQSIFGSPSVDLFALPSGMFVQAELGHIDSIENYDNPHYVHRSWGTVPFNDDFNPSLFNPSFEGDSLTNSQSISPWSPPNSMANQYIPSDQASIVPMRRNSPPVYNYGSYPEQSPRQRRNLDIVPTPQSVGVTISYHVPQANAYVAQPKDCNVSQTNFRDGTPTSQLLACRSDDFPVDTPSPHSTDDDLLPNDGFDFPGPHHTNAAFGFIPPQGVLSTLCPDPACSVPMPRDAQSIATAVATAASDRSRAYSTSSPSESHWRQPSSNPQKRKRDHDDEQSPVASQFSFVQYRTPQYPEQHLSATNEEVSHRAKGRKNRGGRKPGSQLPKSTCQEMIAMRDLGACWVCRFQRDKVGDPCSIFYFNV